jgi:glutamate-ammonia-ligase adenylyltransferase
LQDAWRLQQDLTQLIKVALDDSDPSAEPPAFRKLLARAGDARDFKALRRRLDAAQAAARKAYEALVAA